MSEKICIIGSNSFSGATFAAHCLDEGLDVLGMSRSEEPIDPFLPYRWREPELQEHFRFVKADLNRDLDLITGELENFKPSMVVNFASQGMVAESWEAPGDWYRTNTVANIELHDKLRRMAFLERFVHISTPEVYGTCEGTIPEHTNYAPSTPYATSRAACDMSLMNFVQNYNFPVCFTRAANVFGPGQQLYRIIPRTILGIRLGEKLELHGGGVSVRSFIHMDDVSRATLSIAREGKPGEMFHLSTARFVSICDLVEMICSRMGVSFEDNVVVAPERDGKDLAYLLDSAKAEERFGWQPTVTLEDGIAQTISWVDENLDALKQQPLKYIHKK